MGSPQSQPPDIPSLLVTVPFLSQVPVEYLKTLAEQSQVRSLRAGEVVIRQGEFGHSMFVLMAGAVTVHATDDQGETHQVARISRPGEFFGEVALLGRGARTATVKCESEATLLEIEKNHFDRLARKHKGMIEGLETFYHARSIATSLRVHRYLGQLDPQTLEGLARGASMRKFARDEIVYKQGDKSDTVSLVKDGVLKMARRAVDGRMSILAYYNTNDLVGSHDGWGGRPADLVALGQAEIIFLPRAPFEKLKESHPAIYERFQKDNMHRRDYMNQAGQTFHAAMDQLLQEGVEVESLLFINLDRCVRCGQCVRACHTRHKFTRLTRRGPILRRRQSKESSKHEHLLIPSSCRHCRDPECMIGCPTGAIQRTKDGEVDINDNCIGCENCARKCPYGNITMRPLEESEQKVPNVTKRAIKCNMCKGYAYSNCVYNCPRGAVLRVDPFAYFDELQTLTDVIQGEAFEGMQWKRDAARFAKREEDLASKKRVKPRSTWFIPASLILLLLGAVGIMLAFMRSPAPRAGGTPTGIALGIGAFACIGFATFLGARRRMLRTSIGNMEAWTQFHMVIGALGFWAALAHAGFKVTGPFTTLLLFVFGVEVLTGLLGQWIYMTVPRALTRMERGGLAKLVEDLYEEELALRNGIDELLETSPEELRKLADGPVAAAAGSLRARFAGNWNAEEFLAKVREKLSPHLAKLPAKDQQTAGRLVEDMVQRRNVLAQIRCHGLLRGWLVAHIAATGALVVFTLVHVAAMLALVV